VLLNVDDMGNVFLFLPPFSFEMTCYASMRFCIFKILGYLLDLILFSCFVSRLFAFSSLGFVFALSISVLPRKIGIVIHVTDQDASTCFHIF
jgi:hypothetical protein